MCENVRLSHGWLDVYYRLDVGSWDNKQKLMSIQKMHISQHGESSGPEKHSDRVTVGKCDFDVGMGSCQGEYFK